MLENLLERLERSMILLNDEDVVRSSKEALKARIDPRDVVKALTRGIQEVGKKYEMGEYFLSELLMAAEIMKSAMEILNPVLRGKGQEKIGKVVLCTVKGDLHDLGKNLAKVLLESEGFEVFDLGSDVDAEAIVRKIKDTDAEILGLSALLSTTIPYIEIVTESLRNSHMRDNIKVIAGGAGLNEKCAKDFGADAFAIDAVRGTKICVEWAKGNE